MAEPFAAGYVASRRPQSVDDGESLARVKMNNGDRNAAFMDDDEFARYAAGAIARTIKTP